MTNPDYFKPTPVWDSYWRFASERQLLFMRRVSGRAPPWTNDPIIACHRFCNVYRASDRCSQALIREATYDGPQEPEEVVFRTLLFRIFNRIDTWAALRDAGAVSWRKFSPARSSKILSGLPTVYGAAYIMATPPFGRTERYDAHLELIRSEMRSGLTGKIVRSRSLADLTNVFRRMPSVGGFLAYQLALDVCYSELVQHEESEYVIVGPGARDGIYKCLGPTAVDRAVDVVRWCCDHQEEEFGRRSLEFRGLWGRPLQPIDAEGLFCEVSKYARLKHPNIVGILGRDRIKQKFSPRDPTVPPPQLYPPRWRLSPRSLDGTAL